MGTFDGLLTSTLKQLHCDAILELVRGSSIGATLVFGSTKLTECPNCIYDPIGKKSSNKYKLGGPRAFSGICPHCSGRGVTDNDDTLAIDIVPIYNQKNWCNQVKPHTPKNLIATFSLPDTYDQLKRAKELVLGEVQLSTKVSLRYQRYGEPLPCGLGMTCVIETIWERIEN